MYARRKIQSLIECGKQFRDSPDSPGGLDFHYSTKHSMMMTVKAS